MTLVATPLRTRRAVANRAAAPLHPVTQYASDVVEGRIVTGELVRWACQRHLDDLRVGAKRGLRFDATEASRVIAFFPMVLRHYKGEWGPRPGHPQGEPITLEPWQQFVVGAAFGWKRSDGTRRFRKVYVEVAKKNGKTLIAAGVGLLLAFFDNEPGAEVYAGATKRDQAKLLWNDAVRMVKAAPALSKRIQTLAGNLNDPKSASKFQPLGADSDSDQGINVHGAIIDELHVHKDRDLFDNIETATSARRQPLVWIITTAGVRRESLWATERADAVAVVEGRADDDSLLALVYTLDDGEDPFDERVWPKANPNLGVSVNVDTLREQAAAAKRSPGKAAAFLRFRMDLPTAATTRAIDIDEWDANEPDPASDFDAYVERFEGRVADGQSAYAGLDLASIRDLTALLLVFRAADGSYDVLCRFWCPEEGIDARSRIDGVPYRQWADAGWLIATPGNVTDYSFVRAEASHLARRYAIEELGFDRWNATQLVTELMDDGANCVPIPQTYVGLGPAWRELEKVILDHKLRHGGHPILRWMAGNVETETDALGNQKPSKPKSSERIDGIVALDMALSRWIANVAPTSSVYEERGLVEIG